AWIKVALIARAVPQVLESPAHAGEARALDLGREHYMGIAGMRVAEQPPHRSSICRRLPTLPAGLVQRIWFEGFNGRRAACRALPAAAGARRAPRRSRSSRLPSGARWRGR